MYCERDIWNTLSTICSESHKMDKALAEEKADKRLELLAKSYKNRTHKAREDDDDDEYVPSVLLHAEQVKVEVSWDVMHWYFIVQLWIRYGNCDTCE